jgi:serine/threonine protein kinase
LMGQYVAGQLTKALGFGPPVAQLQRSVGFNVEVTPELLFKIAPEIRPVVVGLLSAAEVTLRWSVMMAVVAQRIYESSFGGWRVIIAIPASICVRHVSKLLDDSDSIAAVVFQMFASQLSAAAESAMIRGDATSEDTGQTTIREIGRHFADSRPAFASALADRRTFTAATPQLAAAFKDFSAALLGDRHPIPVLQSFANGEREQPFEAAFAVLQAQAKNTEFVANAPPTKDKCELMTWILKLHEHPTVHRGDLTTFEQVLIQAHRNVAYCGKDLLRFIDAHAQALILVTTTPQSECVGEGGSAIVVSGRFAGVHNVALRFVWDDSTRALREMTLLHGMKKHPNLIMPLIVCRLSANCFVELQPLLPGAVHTVLRDCLGRPTMTEAESWSALGGLLTTLLHLHQHGLAHNDVKPDNILAIATGDPVMPLHLFLTDGEYIRPVAEACEAGTPAYLPVRTAKNKFDGAARDLFAFAVTWIELVCGNETLAPLRFAKLSPLLQYLLLRLLDVTSNTDALASMSAELQGWPEHNCMPPARSISPDTHDSRCRVDIASSATVTPCVDGCSFSAKDTNVCRACGMCDGCAAAMRFSAALPRLAHLYTSDCKRLPARGRPTSAARRAWFRRGGRLCHCGDGDPAVRLVPALAKQGKFCNGPRLCACLHGTCRSRSSGGRSAAASLLPTAPRAFTPIDLILHMRRMRGKRTPNTGL